MRDSFDMLNQYDEKVGSMDYMTFNSEDKIRISDISQFDDGSVYEEAYFEVDPKTYETKRVFIYFKMKGNFQCLNYSIENGKILGNIEYKINGNKGEIKLDTNINYDVLRSEIFSFIQLVDFRDSTELTVLDPMSLKTVNAGFNYEKRHLAGGIEERIHLIGKGIIPDNVIYISNYQIDKIDVLKPPLSIQKVDSRSKRLNSNHLNFKYLDIDNFKIKSIEK